MLVVDNDADGPSAMGDPILDGSNILIDSTGRHVMQRNVCDARCPRLPSFARQAGGKPIRLPGLVTIDMLEREPLEPRRGPCAQVSLVVMAIDDDGTVTVESAYRLATERFQWNVDGARDVFGLVLFTRKHVDELRSRAQHLSDPIPIDLHHHGDTPERPCAAVIVRGVESLIEPSAAPTVASL